MVGLTTRCAILGLVTAFSAGALSACEQNRAKETGIAGTPKATAPTEGVNIIKESPGRFYGKTVIVSGEADKIHNDRAFELDGTGWAFNDNIVVLTKQPVKMVGSPILEDDELIVTGTIRKFVEPDIKRDLGWDLGSDLSARLKDRPVLIATSIRKMNEYGRWTANGEGDTGPITSTMGIVTAADNAVIVGRKVDLGRELVQSVMGKGLWIGRTPMVQVFVVPKDPASIKDIKAGDWVRVTDGSVEKPPADAQKLWNLPANMEGMSWEHVLYIQDASIRKAPPEARN